MQSSRCESETCASSTLRSFQTRWAGTPTRPRLWSPRRRPTWSEKRILFKLSRNISNISWKSDTRRSWKRKKPVHTMSPQRLHQLRLDEAPPSDEYFKRNIWNHSNNEFSNNSGRIQNYSKKYKISMLHARIQLNCSNIFHQRNAKIRYRCTPMPLPKCKIGTGTHMPLPKCKIRYRYPCQYQKIAKHFNFYDSNRSSDYLPWFARECFPSKKPLMIITLGYSIECFIPRSCTTGRHRWKNLMFRQLVPCLKHWFLFCKPYVALRIFVILRILSFANVWSYVRK